MQPTGNHTEKHEMSISMHLDKAEKDYKTSLTDSLSIAKILRVGGTLLKVYIG